MPDVTTFARDVWDGIRAAIRDEWHAGLRWGRALVGALVLYSAVYIPLILRYGVVVHLPDPGVSIWRILDNATDAMRVAPLQTLATLLWWLLVAGVVVLFLLPLFMLSVEIGIDTTARRRRERRRERHPEQDADLWGQALRDAGVDEL